MARGTYFASAWILARLPRLDRRVGGGSRRSRLGRSLRGAVVAGSIMVGGIPPAHADIRSLPFLRIIASESLALPLTELTRNYMMQHAVIVAVLYQSSQRWKQDYLASLHPDVVMVEADQTFIPLLTSGVILPSSVQWFATNQAMLVSRDSSAAEATSGEAILSWDTRLENASYIILPDPDSNPLGREAHSMMASLTQAETIRRKLIMVRHPWMVTSLLSQLPGAVGIAYQSQRDTDHAASLPALSEQAGLSKHMGLSERSKEQNGSLSWHPASVPSEILSFPYYAATYASGQEAIAKSWLHYLASEEAQHILAQYRLSHSAAAPK